MRVYISRKAFIIPIAKFFFLFEFISILKKFYVVINVYQHPLLNSVRILFHTRKEFQLSFRDGTRISVDSIKKFYFLALRENALILQSKIKRYECAGQEVKLYCVDPIGPQIEVFQKEEYKFLEVKMKKVLDVGANIGDTSLYFLFKSASKVIAVEPYPANCNIIEKNIHINNVDKDKIIILNAGVGVRSKAKIPVEIINSGASESIDSANGKDIDIIPLSDLINKYELINGVLKMDCEGCEYDALLSESCEVLTTFEQMQIEYHYGPSLLVQKLRLCGFRVSYSSPKFIPNINVENFMTLRGYIYARRN